MPRRIVLIRSHDPLQEGWRQRAFGPAGLLLEERVKVAGVRFDETYHPVQVWRRSGRGDDPPAAGAFTYGGGRVATYAVRVEADDDDAIQRLRRDRHPEIVGVFTDAAVSPFPSAYCGDAAIGDTADVARGLGVPALRRARLTCRARARRTTAQWWRTTSVSRPRTRRSSTTRCSSPRRGTGPRFSPTPSRRSRISWNV